MVVTKKITDEELEKIRLSDDELIYLNNLADSLISALRKKIAKKNIDAEIFLGGSLAKKTIIKKSKYDVDIFIRFDSHYSEEKIRENMKRIFFWLNVPRISLNIKKIHGSRDYYRLTISGRKNISFEVVPTVKISSPSEARNITDLSYFHVDYVKNKIAKNKKLAENIILAKSFCHAQKCYGAESYINGFSGYSLELLIINYRSFARFLREMANVKDKIIIDPGKLYKNKSKIIEELNPGKLHSPIILIDPTYKERNAARALSQETFRKFQKSAKKFLESPNSSFFEYKTTDVPYLKTTAQNVHGIFSVFEIKTKKQEGDIAGSKMLKFSKLLTRELSRYYEVVESEYDYYGEKKSNVYYVLKRKNEIINMGPSIHNSTAAAKFKEKHKIWYVEDGRIKSSTPTDISIDEFFKIFKKSHKKTMKEMGIKKVRII